MSLDVLLTAFHKVSQQNKTCFVTKRVHIIIFLPKDNTTKQALVPKYPCLGLTS